MVDIHLFIPKDQIAFVRFILEAYEGLAIQSSPPGSTKVVWQIPESRLGEAHRLLEALAKEAGVRLLESPEKPERLEKTMSSEKSESPDTLKE